jgi:hypothetical protein
LQNLLDVPFKNNQIAATNTFSDTESMNAQHSPPLNRQTLESNTHKNRKLPPRAYLVFAITFILISFSIGLRMAGISLDRLGRALIDGPTLISVAFSSLIWATYRNQKTIDLIHSKSPSEEELP